MGFLRLALFWLSGRTASLTPDHWFIRCSDCWRAFDANSAHQSVFVCPRCLEVR